MKYVPSIACASLALILVACGGSSNNNANNNNNGNGAMPAGTIQIIAQLVPPASGTYLPIQQIGPSTCPLVYKYIDPTNIQSGDTWQFVLAAVDGNTVTPLPATGWTSSDASGTFGSISYDKGILTTSSQTRVAQTVSVPYNGQVYRAQYDILAREAKVRGQVVAHDTGKAIQGVEVDFYGPNSVTDNTLVFRGKALTQPDGTFQAAVAAQIQVPDGSGGMVTFIPTQYFQINNSSLPSTYQQYFEYNSTVYQSGLLSCVAPVQMPGTSTPMPLVSGNNDLISVTQCTLGPIQPTNGWIVIYSSAEATPNPNGCSS